MSMNFATDVVVNSSNSLQTKILKIPTSSNGNTYGVGSSGQILKSNGNSVFWGDDAYTINTMIAPVEATTTASQLYNVNDLFIYNKQLYKTTSTIAASTTITPGNNCTVVPYLTDLILEQASPLMIGATSSVAGTAGLVPAPTTSDTTKFLRGDGTWADGGKPMVILSYGSSTWQDFINAYNSNVIVYCRASSNSNPASGSQTRMAFMAYVNDASNPTNVEFQYYRSMSSHSATAMGDEVYVYKLTNSNGGTWSVTTRKASIKEIAVASGSKLGVSWSSDKVTLSNTMTADDMPMSTSDNTTTKAAIEAKYTKPSGGIPSTDLADTYLTSHQDISGKVSGPSSATDLHIAIFDGTGGKIIKDSGFTIATSVPANAIFTDTTYSDMVGASAFGGGTAGLVPAPVQSDIGNFLCGNGTWVKGLMADTQALTTEEQAAVQANLGLTVMNSVACDEEGYILDARMGKYINDKVNNIGTIIDGTNNSNLTVESGAWVNGISSITLTAGHWIVIAHSRFSSSFTGDAAIALRSTSFIQQSIVRGGGTNGSGLCTVYIFSISSSNAPYSLGLSLYQNSGSDKTANYVSLRAIKISA